MNTERNCQSCKYYKDGYCENLELKPCYPQKGCDDFENKDLDVLDKIKAEIIELRSRQNVGVLECLDIIDKYKTESEE